MPVRFQLVIDCADADRLARFWAAALGYELAPAPAGFATWNGLGADMDFNVHVNGNDQGRSWLR